VRGAQAIDANSDRPGPGYEIRTVAAELHGFVEALGLTRNGPIDVVGHDIGTFGYFYAAEWPDDVKRIAVFERSSTCSRPTTANGSDRQELVL
jgi:pimeloyl-ACP methyl ester carboxylesterase